MAVITDRFLLPKLQTLEYSGDCILYQMPAGKPNPTEPCPIGVEDNRTRVVQSAQKGVTCWYNGFSSLRKRIGKNSPPVLLKERKIEKTVSTFRKKNGYSYQSFICSRFWINR